MTYRDDDEALRARSATLRDELSQVDRLVAILEFQTNRRTQLEAELADVERRRSRPVALPLLERTRIASPCSADWTKMVGDDRVRHCLDCQKNVYDLSAMTAADAEALLREHEGDLCIRLARRADGTIVTSDCPVGARRRLRLRTACVMAAGLVLGAITAHALRPAPPLHATEDHETYSRQRRIAPPRPELAALFDSTMSMGVVARPGDRILRDTNIPTVERRRFATEDQVDSRGAPPRRPRPPR
jgi:hypothetical protein